MSDIEINSFPGKGFKMPPSDRGWLPLDIPVELHIDSVKLVKDFAEALLEKLLKSQRKYGYTNGWLDPNWKDQCRIELDQHVDKGDPLDVAAYAAFLWYHGWPTTRVKG